MQRIMHFSPNFCVFLHRDHLFGCFQVVRFYLRCECPSLVMPRKHVRAITVVLHQNFRTQFVCVFCLWQLAAGVGSRSFCCCLCIHLWMRLLRFYSLPVLSDCISHESRFSAQAELSVESTRCGYSAVVSCIRIAMLRRHNSSLFAQSSETLSVGGVRCVKQPLGERSVQVHQRCCRLRCGFGSKCAIPLVF